MSFLSKLLKRDGEPKKPAEEAAAPVAPPKPIAPTPVAKPAQPAAPDLDRIRKELMEIASIVGDGGETISHSPDSMVELRFADIVKLAPQAFTAMENLPSIGDLELAVVVPNLYDQLAKGKVTTTLRNLTADVPSEHVSQYTLDHGEDIISLPLPMVIQAVQPNELKKRTTVKERDLGQNRLPDLFTAGKVKAAAAAAAAASGPLSAPPEERTTQARPAMSQADLAAAAEKIRNYKPMPKPAAPAPKPEEPAKAVETPPPPPAPKVEPKPEPVVEKIVEEKKPEPMPEPVRVETPAPAPEPAKVEEKPAPPKLEPEEEELVAAAEAISRQDTIIPTPEPVEAPAASAQDVFQEPPPAPHHASPPPVVVKVEEEAEPAFVDAESKPGAVMCNGIDINSADAEELVRRLNTVGRKLAEKIVSERTLGGNYKNLMDLARVPGIRGKKFERITGMPWRWELHRHRELILQLVGSDDTAVPDVRAVAARFKEMKAYLGCIIILEDGFVLASNWENTSGEALGAFAPQMFKKIGKYVNHLKLGSIRCLTFFTEDQPITIVRSGKIFFAAVHAPNNFGRKQVEVVQALAEELGGRLVG
jgi:competence ComEA-like helix-hairpin-helix protein